MKLKIISLLFLTSFISSFAMEELPFSKIGTYRESFFVKVNCKKFFDLYLTCKNESVDVEAKDESNPEPVVICTNKENKKLIFSYPEFKLCAAALDEIEESKKA